MTAANFVFISTAGEKEVVEAGIQGAGRRHRHVPVEADASVGEAGQQLAVFLADGHQGVLDLEILPRSAAGAGGGRSDRRWGRCRRCSAGR